MWCSVFQKIVEFIKKEVSNEGIGDVFSPDGKYGKDCIGHNLMLATGDNNGS